MSASEASEVPSERGAALRRARSAEERRVIDKIGRYTVLGQIAGGGMGSVFVAQMRGPAAFSRLVAIKCLSTRWLNDPTYVARFTTEVKLSTLIRHPNVVQVLDVVEEGGELFLVMEYVDGVTLAAMLTDLGRAQRALPVGVALGILSAALRGLHAAHEAVDHDGVPSRIVHGDVSPHNIMLGRTGHVQVLDFGAANAMGYSQRTAPGVLIGKLSYMAPEHVRGEGSSPRSDVFSAGVVLWEALVGRRLFYQPGLDRKGLLQALVRKPVQRPSTLRNDVPKGVDDLVKRALSRDPESRFQTALEFAQALESIGAAQWAPTLAALVGDLCSERLAEKSALLRSGMITAAAAPPTPPVPAALVVASRSSLAGMSMSFALAPRLLRAPGVAWLGAALIAGSALWWTLDGAMAERNVLSGEREATHTDALVTAGRNAESELLDIPMLLQDPVTHDATDAAIAAPITVSSLPITTTDETPPETRPEEPSRATADRYRAAPSERRSRRVRKEPPVSTAKVAARLCDPPTYIDAAGIRHFKKDCL